MRKFNYSFLNCAKNMPPLTHSISVPFDITKSDVAKWLVSQPDIMQKVFDMACNKGLIKFNSTNKCWQGVDYKNDYH